MTLWDSVTRSLRLLVSRESRLIHEIPGEDGGVVLVFDAGKLVDAIDHGLHVRRVQGPRLQWCLGHTPVTNYVDIYQVMTHNTRVKSTNCLHPDASSGFVLDNEPSRPWQTAASAAPDHRLTTLPSPFHVELTHAVPALMHLLKDDDATYSVECTQTFGESQKPS